MISPTRAAWVSFRLAASLATVVVLPTPVGPTSATIRRVPGTGRIGGATAMHCSTASHKAARIESGCASSSGSSSSETNRTSRRQSTSGTSASINCE